MGCVSRGSQVRPSKEMALSLRDGKKCSYRELFGQKELQVQMS